MYTILEFKVEERANNYSEICKNEAKLLCNKIHEDNENILENPKEPTKLESIYGLLENFRLEISKADRFILEEIEILYDLQSNRPLSNIKKTRGRPKKNPTLQTSNSNQTKLSNFGFGKR